MVNNPLAVCLRFYITIKIHALLLAEQSRLKNPFVNYNTHEGVVSWSNHYFIAECKVITES